jgi:PAS domain S-box-containing protein
MKPTDLKKIVADQENLKRILDNLSEGIIAHDIERHILFFNRTAEKITGYKRNEALGRDCHEVFGGPFCGGKCSFKEPPPDPWVDKTYPLNILTKQGEPRRIEMTITGMNDNHGGLEGVIASFRDITDMIGLKVRAGQLNGFAGIIGQDHKMRQIYKQIRELGSNDYPVHITGETGTGKELVANAIHNEGRQYGGAFVPINCAALPEGVLESELFGHVKGAFTGAMRDKKGRFELAHGGTIFLDEVADLPKSVQAKLLRVLQEGTFERVGGEKTMSVDVRLISATNRSLRHEVDRGAFREDLFYRISVFPVHMPPLRQRKGDIPLLLDHFLKKTQMEVQKPAYFSREALDIMVNYPWPGNVRELQSAIRFAIVRCRGRMIQPENLPMELKMWKETRSSLGSSGKLDIESVRAALAQSGGNKAKAARFLGVGRATLYRFLTKYQDLT